MRVGRPLQVRDAGLGGQEGPARIDLVHQVVALHVRRLGAGQADGRGVVDADVDAAELGRRLLHRLEHIGVVAHVDDQRQGVAAGFLDLLGGRIDGAGQVLVRLGGLGGDGDIGPVAGGAQRDGQADAAAGAGDEEGLA